LSLLHFFWRCINIHGAFDHYPEVHGYLVIEAGKLERLWFEGDIIPKVLVNILEENGNYEDITDEIHTVDDYDENDDYDAK